MTTVPLASHAVGRARERRWRRRPWLRRVLEGLAIVGPFALSIGVAWLLTETTSSPAGVTAAAARWVAIAVVSSAVLLASERVTRRLLPVASLFDLTLVFPDRAPSRFKVALRTGTTRQLERRIAELKEEAVTDPSIGAAQRLLELAAALNVHDRITRGHAERVRAYTQLIAAELGLSDEELDRVRWAGLLHDIGKLFVPSEILNKTGSLTDDEFEIIKQHPDMGREIIEDLVPWLGDAARAVWEHHEKWDGTGYPRGLRGEEISLAGRIVAVADVYDVMTSARSYKEPVSPREARAELARCAGSHFDPVMVRAFLNVSLGRVHRATGPLSWIMQLPLFPTAVFTSARAAGGAALLTGALGASSAGIGTGLADSVVDFLDPRSPSAAFASGVETDGVTIDSPDPLVIVTSSTSSTVPRGAAPGTTTVPGLAAPATAAPTVETAPPPDGGSSTSSTVPSSTVPSPTVPSSIVQTPTTLPSLTTLPTVTTLPVGTTLPVTTTLPSLTTLPTLPSLTTLPTVPSLTTLPTVPSLTTLPTVPTTLPPLPTTLPTVPTTLPPLPTTLPDLPGLP